MSNASLAAQARKVKFVSGTNGGRSTPYLLEERTLVKRVQNKHIYRARWAVGIDVSIWLQYRDCVEIVRFEFPDGSVRELTRDEFEKKSFLHGNNVVFVRTRFVKISELRLVHKRQNPHQLALFATAGV